MKAVQFAAFGVAAEVADTVDLPEPGAPGVGEVVIDVEASPINPSDLLMLSGDYGMVKPKLPAFAGGEGVGRIRAVGDGVADLKPGDLVLLPAGRGCWREALRIPAKGLFALPAQADPQQLAMLRVNPPTAALMLRDYVDLKPGDWVIQNAANSGVGQALIVLAKAAGVKTVNLVRRDSLVAPLTALGADAVLVDGPGIEERVAAATGGVAPKLGIDAVGGEATARLAACLSDGGTVVNYGLLSGQPCQVSPKELVFRDVSLRGFWLARWFQRAAPADIAALYGELLQLVAGGALKVPVEATYPLDQIKQALAHAAREGRGGKILITPKAGH